MRSSDEMLLFTDAAQSMCALDVTIKDNGLVAAGLHKCLIYPVVAACHIASASQRIAVQCDNEAWFYEHPYSTDSDIVFHLPLFVLVALE